MIVVREENERTLVQSPLCLMVAITRWGVHLKSTRTSFCLVGLLIKLVLVIPVGVPKLRDLGLPFWESP